MAASVIAGLALLTPGVAQANQTITGEGSATVPVNRITQSVIVEISINSDGPVQVQPILSNGGKVLPWVDSTGPWSGTVFQEKEFKPVVRARVTAAGPWTISVKPLASAPKVTRGTGTAVIQLKKMARGTVTKRFTYRGQGDFKIFPISAKGMSGFPSIEESGPYTGKAILPPGTKYIAVVATGNWQMR